jgi:hypothetical protein
MLTKVLVATCIAEEVMTRLLVHTWIGKMMINISAPTVSVCMGDVQRLLDEGG